LCLSHVSWFAPYGPALHASASYRSPHISAIRRQGN
jgi:hypothetical protein